MNKSIISAALACLAFANPTLGAKAPYATDVGKSYPKEVYWGDTHLHTSYSFDASMMGNKIIGPAEAYQFARGEEVKTNQGLVAKLSRPLDFLMVADHAEYLGLLPKITQRDPEILKDPTGARWADLFKQGGDAAWKALFEMHHDIDTATPSFKNDIVRRSAWQEIIEAADHYNTPGRFTAFAGYEWTTMPSGNNLHRVVLFADDASKTGQVLPFSSFDSEDPEDLWKYMSNYEDLTGGRVLAIPHNGNVSDGLMFSLTQVDGKPLNTQYANTRRRWEPLYEVTQIKGDGETHPTLSPEDEFADFERLDKGNLLGTSVKHDDMLAYEYARSALKLGLSQQRALGTNPFKFGMIGSTDAHTGLSAVAENNYWGKFYVYEPSASRANQKAYTKGVNGKLWDMKNEELGASGYAAVWAKENTRAAIFDAMMRRETYATTGPRMVVRFFASWDFAPDDIDQPNFVAHAYDKGVPMGGELSHAPSGKPIGFLVTAQKDPEGANLDRVQIVKGWIDASGTTHEKVYDVVWSGQRSPNENGKLPPVGNTVDIENATWRNSIGATQLSTVWYDPDFDPREDAFYYTRVIEIPTPRWTAYDEKYFNYKLDRLMPATVQERAYTSPIWYSAKP